MTALPWERARDRIDFRLTFAATDEPRDWVPDELMGPDIPDAFATRPGATAPGSWSQESDWDTEDHAVTEDQWLSHYLSMAVNEAIHEALEWFRVDGRPWLDPHGRQESEIYKLTNKLAENLAKLAIKDRGTTS